MHLRRFNAVVFALAAAFGTTAMAQTPSPSNPATNPSTGTGATPGGIPPSTTTPGTGNTSPGMGGTGTSPGIGGTTRPELGGTGPGHGMIDFSAVDSNRDGFVSRAEASGAGLGGQFTTLDKNNDGRLDRAEFAAHRGDNARVPGMRSGTSSSTGTGPMSTR
jgi:hypothetical protein